MKRMSIVLLILTVLSSASAQSSEFIGLGVKAEFGPAVPGFFNPDDTYIPFPPEALMLEVQAGDYNLFGPVGFRQTIATDLFYLELGGDLLVPLTTSPRIYLGGGASLTAGDGTVLAVRGVAGAEFLLARQLGLFSEFNPGYYIARGKSNFDGTYGAESYGFKVRFGFNVHP